MQVIGRDKLVEFYSKHDDAKNPLEAWYKETEFVKWQNPNELKLRYPKASILSGNQVIFDIKGGSYRLLTHVYYRNQKVIIKKLGTHEEYNRW